MKWIIIATLLLSATTARAECATVESATATSPCVVMEREGQRGVWFTLDEADGLRRLRLEIPELRLQVTSLEQAATIQLDRVTLYRESSQLRLGALNQTRTQWEASLGREHQLRVALGAWYRSPAFWLAIGLIVTVAATVALAAAVGRI